LGTAEVDAQGAVTEVNNGAPGVQRHCYPLKWGVASGTEAAEGVPAGESVRMVVDHSAQADFRVPGALRVEALTEYFTVTVTEHFRGDCFVVELFNQGAEQADCQYQWRREGILR
jgi:hypothetical protein